MLDSYLKISFLTTILEIYLRLSWTNVKNYLRLSLFGSLAKLRIGSKKKTRKMAVKLPKVSTREKVCYVLRGIMNTPYKQYVFDRLLLFINPTILCLRWWFVVCCSRSGKGFSARTVPYFAEK